MQFAHKPASSRPRLVAKSLRPTMRVECTGGVGGAKQCDTGTRPGPHNRESSSDLNQRLRLSQSSLCPTRRVTVGQPISRAPVSAVVAVVASICHRETCTGERGSPLLAEPSRAQLGRADPSSELAGGDITSIGLILNDKTFASRLGWAPRFVGESAPVRVRGDWQRLRLRRPSLLAASEQQSIETAHRESQDAAIVMM